MNRKIILVLILGMFMKGCPLLLLTSSKFRYRPGPEFPCYSLAMDGVVNRWIDSPWPRAPKDGYREWRSRHVICGNYVFNGQKDGRILLLVPGQSVKIELAEAIDARAVAVLCSAYGLGEDALPFSIDVANDKGISETLPFVAFDWTKASSPIPGKMASHESIPLKIRQNGTIGYGQIGLSAASYRGAVKGIEIRNGRAQENQYLLVLAVSLKMPTLKGNP